MLRYIALNHELLQITKPNHRHFRKTVVAVSSIASVIIFVMLVLYDTNNSCVGY